MTEETAGRTGNAAARTSNATAQAAAAAKATSAKPVNGTKPVNGAKEAKPAKAAKAAPSGGKRGRAAGSDYTAASIQVLEGLEAVRRRPGMYIGSTDERGLHHLVWEVVDNSIDEAMAGHAHKIVVTIKADGWTDPDGTVHAGQVIVEDDGRGVPVGKHSTGKDALEVVHTVLHAGGKFGGGGYKVSGGLHGVGVSVVNALSEWMRVESARDGSVWAQEYERGKPEGPVKKLGPQGTRRGTLTSFRADPEMFETIDYSFDTISQRLRESAYLNKGVWITLIDERNDRERSFYFEGGLQSFVRHLNRNKEVLHTRPIYVERTRGHDRRRGRAPVQRHVHGERPRLRQQHQHGRRRHARHRLPGRADQLAERLGAPRGVLKDTDTQPLRRRRPRGPDRGHQRQADRSAVRGPDQGQARQRRGQGPGPDRRRATASASTSTRTRPTAAGSSRSA